ncbi:MAG: protease pro-enzyme activation domain-containing protein, partial [Actinomycetota bacterium]|nr:protease pro-enzyme activation domain-containing protein [Actinomycetota bacterium]
MPKRTILAALTTAAALATGVLALPPSAQAVPTPKAVPHSKPAWVGHATHLGTPARTNGVKARVYLSPRGGFAALRDAAVAASTPGSASYHHFLTAAQYHARYAPSAATVRSVESWLHSSGLQVTGVESHNRYVSIRGSVDQANKAFSTSIQRYRHGGRTVQAPSTPLKVPASLASSVLTVTGLDTTPHLAAPATHQAPPPAGFRNARPCSQYFGQITAKYQADFKTPLPKFRGKYLPYAPCGY